MGSGFKEIQIPASVRIIGESAFDECKNLKSVIFPEGTQLRKIEENAFSKSGFTEVQIPASLRIIGESAFYNCENLSKVTFTENSQLREIGS